MTGIGGPKFGRFALVGLAATATYALVAWALARLAGVSPLPASVIAWLIASAVSYLAHRRVTFRSARAHRAALPRFFATNCLGLCVAAGLSLLGEWLGLPVEAALAATCVTVPALSYFLLDRIVFPSRFRRAGLT